MLYNPKFLSEILNDESLNNAMVMFVLGKAFKGYRHPSNSTHNLME